MRSDKKSRIISDQSQTDYDRDHELAALINRLPGGVMCCENTPELELLEYSEGFLQLIGYTADEVEELLGNRFQRLVVQEDLAAAWESVSRQLLRGDTKEIEYRLRRKNGKLIWILDRGKLVRRADGKECFYCVLMDVTAAKTAQEELRLSLERHQIIMDQTNDIIFEWDTEKQEIQCSQNWEKKFGYAPAAHGARWLEEEEGVHPEDRRTLRDLRERVLLDGSYGEAEFRVADHTGRYLWCRARVTLQRDGEGAPRKAVGVIVDIDDEKRQTQRLERLAQRDTLTGLLNKGTTHELIEEWLSGPGREGQDAFLIIDIDNFKLVNDTYGHLGGDVMLSDIAHALQGLFRGNDVIGRVGGDEFCVLIKNIRGPEIVERKAEEILEIFHGLLPEERNFPVSCSIGIALTRVDGSDFQELFQNADMALYYAKEKGKNQYAFYGPGMERPETRRALWNLRSARRDRIESEGGLLFRGGDLAEYTFRALYEAGDAESAIPSILEIVGRKLDVSRVYIFEFSDDGRSAVNTFEWCGEGVEPEIENLRCVPVEVIAGPLAELRENGVFYSKDVSQLETAARELLEAQGIRSMLQCAIHDGRQLKGVVGFDECRSNRMWTQEQVETLSFIAEIVSTFLLKRRAQERTQQLMESMRDILDHQRAWIYVIDPDSHAILYANRETMDVLPELRIGQTCHSAFYRAGSPCSHCPARNLDETGTGTGIVYSAVLDKWVEARVETISWMGSGKACLFTCRETEKKEEEKP